MRLTWYCSGENWTDIAANIHSYKWATSVYFITKTAVIDQDKLVDIKD